MNAIGGRDVVAQCLATLDNQIVEPGQLETVVVSDASGVGTTALLDDWSRRGFDRRAIVASRQNRADALNTVLESSRRDIVLFLDDVSLVPPTWARAHLLTYQMHDGIGAVGGPIGLHWPEGRPSWLTTEVADYLNAFDLGDEEGSFPTGREPSRTNLSVDRRAAIAAGGFDPRVESGIAAGIGRGAFGLADRLRDRDWKIWYQPTAAAVAQVLPGMIERRALLQSAWADGVLDARAGARAAQRSRQWWVAQAIREARAAGRAWWQERSTGERFVGRARATAHAAGAVESLRGAVRGR